MLRIKKVGVECIERKKPLYIVWEKKKKVEKSSYLQWILMRKENMCDFQCTYLPKQTNEERTNRKDKKCNYVSTVPPPESGK